MFIKNLVTSWCWFIEVVTFKFSTPESVGVKWSCIKISTKQNEFLNLNSYVYVLVVFIVFGKGVWFWIFLSAEVFLHFCHSAYFFVGKTLNLSKYIGNVFLSQISLKGIKTFQKYARKILWFPLWNTIKYLAACESWIFLPNVIEKPFTPHWKYLMIKFWNRDFLKSQNKQTWI